MCIRDRDGSIILPPGVLESMCLNPGNLVSLEFAPTSLAKEANGYGPWFQVETGNCEDVYKRQLQGCGGEAQEWIDGINELLTQEGILLERTEFKHVKSFCHEGLDVYKRQVVVKKV